MRSQLLYIELDHWKIRVLQVISPPAVFLFPPGYHAFLMSSKYLTQRVALLQCKHTEKVCTFVIVTVADELELCFHGRLLDQASCAVLLAHAYLVSPGLLCPKQRQLMIAWHIGYRTRGRCIAEELAWRFQCQNRRSTVTFYITNKQLLSSLRIR